MLYMGNVNRFIFWILIPLIFASYIAFRALVWYNYDSEYLEIIEQHSVNLSNLNDVNCLILGGSNSNFSLSAEQMSRDKNFTCYNISIFDEGLSDDMFFQIIDSMPINKIEITNVFYSTTLLLNPNKSRSTLRENNGKFGIFGNNSFNLLGRSFASFLMNLLEGKPFFYNTKKYPKPNSSGDFNFDKYDGCNSSSIRVGPALAWNGNDVFKKLLNARISRIQSLFQKDSKIYFILPSNFRKKESEYERTRYSNFLQETLTNQSIIYIEQSPYVNRDVLCDSVDHANELGRELRTSELLKLTQTFETD